MPVIRDLEDLYPMWLREVSKNAHSLSRDQVPEDVTGAVAFFLSDGAAFVTGQTLLVGGGSHFN